MYKKIMGILLALISLWSCQSENETGISFKISPSSFEDKTALKIEVDCIPDPSGTTILEFADQAWGQENLHGVLKELKLPENEGQITMNRDSGWIVINHPKDIASLRLDYKIVQDFEDAVSTDKVYRPIVQDNYFHLFSHNFFMLPKQYQDSLKITLQWANFPKDFTIHNSFGSKEPVQEIVTSKEAFGSAIFVGGDFRVYQDEIEGNAISLATRGDWIPFKGKEVFKVLKNTLKLQRDFWNDHSQDYFTVTMQPFPQEKGSSFQGTGLTNSFATSVSNNEFADIQQMVYLFNHELMHNWIGLTIENENEEEQYWFSEGFTEYYAFKNIAKNGINGLDSSYFIDEINATLRNLYSLSVKDAPNSEINYENFWSNREYGKLPYYRGALFAFILDRRISKNTGGMKSLDDVMLEILSDARENGQNLNHDYFLNVVRPYYGDGLEEFFQSHIITGKAFPWASLFEDFNLEYEKETDIYELGFELSEDQGTILSVVEGSNASKAGLQAGDRLTSRSIWYGSTAKKVELGLARKSGQIIRFYPIKRVQLPQLVKTAENKAAILP